MVVTEWVMSVLASVPVWFPSGAMGENVYPAVWMEDERPHVGGWVPDQQGWYPGKLGVSVEEWCTVVMGMPTAGARGFYVSLWLNDAVKRGVDRVQVAWWVEYLRRRWPEATEILGAIGTMVRETWAWRELVTLDHGVWKWRWLMGRLTAYVTTRVVETWVAEKRALEEGPVSEVTVRAEAVEMTATVAGDCGLPMAGEGWFPEDRLHSVLFKPVGIWVGRFREDAVAIARRTLENWVTKRVRGLMGVRAARALNDLDPMEMELLEKGGKEGAVPGGGFLGAEVNPEKRTHQMVWKMAWGGMDQLLDEAWDMLFWSVEWKEGGWAKVGEHGGLDRTSWTRWDVVSPMELTDLPPGFRDRWARERVEVEARWKEERRNWARRRTCQLRDLTRQWQLRRMLLSEVPEEPPVSAEDWKAVDDAKEDERKELSEMRVQSLVWVCQEKERWMRLAEMVGKDPHRAWMNLEDAVVGGVVAPPVCAGIWDWFVGDRWVGITKCDVDEEDTPWVVADRQVDLGRRNKDMECDPEWVRRMMGQHIKGRWPSEVPTEVVAGGMAWRCPACKLVGTEQCEKVCGKKKSKAGTPWSRHPERPRSPPEVDLHQGDGPVIVPRCGSNRTWGIMGRRGLDFAFGQEWQAADAGKGVF